MSWWESRTTETKIENHDCCKCGAQATLRIRWDTLFWKYFCDECEPDLNAECDLFFD